MLIDFVPPWALFFISTVLVILAVEAGYVIGRRVYRNNVNERESPVAAIAGAILGLQAFMLAFTFSIVSDRYDVKKGLVREHANAVRTAWQRSDFMPEPDLTEAKTLLRRYVDRNITVAESNEPALARSAIGEAEEIQHRLWELAVKHGKTDLNTDIGSLLVEATNDLASLQEQRYNLGVEARIPTAIWFVLVALLILGMMAVGYQTAIAESRRPRITLVLAISFSLVIALIAVLDHPLNDIVTIPQAPMRNLQAEFNMVPESGTSITFSDPERR